MHTGPTGNLRCCSYRLRDITDWPTHQGAEASIPELPRLVRLLAGIGRIRQGAVDAIEQFAHALAGRAAFLVQALLAVQQVVGDVEGGHHGNPVGADDFAAGADLAHLAVQVTGGAFQVGALVVRAIDAVFLVENLHGEGIRLAHVSCSKAFRRKIIASTLCLAISFFSIR